MPAGSPGGDRGPFTPTELARLERAVHNAEEMSGLTFSLYVGASEADPRGYARRLHSALTDPERSVLVMCDPGFHALEIVCGSEASMKLTAAKCGLAAAAMQSSFLADDIVGGLAAGIQQLGDAARAPRTLHLRA